MPDTDAVGHLHTLAGEAAMRAERLRRDARDLRADADSHDRLAAAQEQRATWYTEAADALGTG